MRGGYRDTGVEDYMCTLRPAENDVALVEAVQGRLARTATTRVTSFTITDVGGWGKAKYRRDIIEKLLT